MSSLIQSDNQIFILGSLLLFVIIVLWILQYLVIRYAKKLMAQVAHYWVALTNHIGLGKRLVRLETSYPKRYHFFRQRLSTHDFKGLALTLL